jgi:pimeloyl-ACP methyl ester carboxylesterase
VTTFHEWRARGTFFEHRGHRIFVQSGGKGGEGATLLCIHGFPTASWDWHALWPRLTSTFSRVIAADMIGFGWSDKPTRYAYSIFDQADLQEALIRAHRVSRVMVLAHDYGDTVTQELLARDLERDEPIIAAACLLNGGLFPEAHRARLVQKILLTPIGPWLARMTNARAFARSFAAIFGPSTRPSRQELAEFWELVHHAHGERISYRLLSYIPERRMHRARWVRALTDARAPIRFINGLADPVSGAHMVERYRQIVPNADVVELPNIGHYPQVEDPDGVWRALDLLRSVGAGT